MEKSIFQIIQDEISGTIAFAKENPLRHSDDPMVIDAILEIALGNPTLPWESVDREFQKKTTPAKLAADHAGVESISHR